jgi:hypothetical protein
MVYACLSWACSMKEVMLVQLWRKLVPDLEDDDFQGFPNEISKSEILDIVYCMISSGNINEDDMV